MAKRHGFKAFQSYFPNYHKGGGLFLVCEDFGRMFDHSFPTYIFFLKVEISLRTLIPLFKPGLVHSGSVRWDDCDQVFPDELRVCSFPDRFQNYAWIVA